MRREGARNAGRGLQARPPRRSFSTCAIYTRQSVTRSKSGDFTSCRAQWEACLRYIAAQKDELWIPVRGRFDDEGFSGATLERPGLQRLLGRIRAGEVDRVVVQRLDRLTRSVKDWVELVGTFQEHGVGLSVVAGDLHAGELATSDMVLNMLASFAELEREMIGERLRDARDARRARGLRSAGRVPFGYAADPTTRQLLPAAAEADVVQRFFAMAAAGERPAAIAKWASSNGHRTRGAGSKEGSSWSSRAVLRVLRNPVYAGGLPGECEWNEGAQPAIVSREVFDSVQEAISSRRTRAPGPRPPVEAGADPFLLRGLVKCTRCGRPMTTSASGKLSAPSGTRRRRKGQGGPRYYRCRGPQRCPDSQIAARELEGSVMTWLRDPPEDQVPEALARHPAYLMSGWQDMWPVFRLRLLQVVLREVRWDGSASSFELVLDEDVIAAMVDSETAGRVDEWSPGDDRTERRQNG